MITIDDIQAAAKRLDGVARRTPLFEFAELNEKVGGRILLKAETLQLTGSFKIRGAYNRISQLTEQQRQAGIIAWSSGNHAQGVAKAAQIVGTKATIVMPEDAPKAKVEGTRSYGADIVFFDRYTEDREVIGNAIAKDKGLVLVPSYDDPHVIAGQGTCGLEIAQDAIAHKIDIDQLFVCAGGGGLTSGSAIAFADHLPRAKIYTVEPEGYDDIALSLEKGERVVVDTSRKSIADALLPPTPGRLTWPILKKYVTSGHVVSDDEICNAVRYAFQRLKLVCEPGGAAALAAVLAGRAEVKGRTTAITLSGGNVDPEVFSKVILG